MFPIMACLFILFFPAICQADDNSPSPDQIKDSVNQLEKDWDNTKKDYKKKFKMQMEPIEKQINELKKALDNGDPHRREQINGQMEEMKELRDKIRQNYHEITVTSLVDLGAIQKHFKNAKDDTKD